MALLNEFRRIFGQAPQRTADPIPMILFCPNCGLQHIDAPSPQTGWMNPPHRSHLCEACDHVWRPADVPTVGVAEIQTHGMIDNDPPVRERIELDQEGG